MFYIMLNDCFQHKQCTLKHIRTSKLAKFFRVVSTCPDSTRREGERGKGRGREKERRGKGKGRRHDGKKGEEGRHGEFGWGICATAPRGGG